MQESDLDREILKLMEKLPEMNEEYIACELSVPEELVKTRIENFKDIREKILIMSCGHSSHNSLKAALEAENYSVVEVPRSFSALETVKTEKPDLVLLDTGLADIDGFEICKQLKASSRYWWIPIVMLSERSELEDRIEAFNSGAYDYITAPFNPLELKARVGTILRHTRI
jgi:two-component system, OmpR family, alkaline phosphatase synthesis response regulator PhoP